MPDRSDASTTGTDGYVYDPAANYYALTAAAGTTVTITADQTTVFGGAADLVYYGGGSSVVANAPDATAQIQVWSYGGDTIWAGAGVLTFDTWDHPGFGTTDTIVLGANAAPPSVLQLFANDAGAQTNIMDWAAAGTTATIHCYQTGHATIFGGVGALDVSAQNTTFVLDGAATGATRIDSIGNNTVFAGSGDLTLIDGSLRSDDTLVTGSGSVQVQATDYGDHALHVFDGHQNGDLSYAGGGQSATFALSTGTATLFAGEGAQDITLSDTVSATVVGGGSSTGMQFIHATGQTGALHVWDGAETVTVQAGAGATDIHAGTGSLAIASGTGTLAVDLSAGGLAQLALNGFTAGDIDVSGFDPARDTASFTAGSVRDHQVSSGSLLVQLQDGHTATFQGVTGSEGLSFG